VVGWVVVVGCWANIQTEALVALLTDALERELA
jgi:hypothetical protein